LAPNVLVSRRSYAEHHALLLRNGDPFGKEVRVALPQLDGEWFVIAPLEGWALQAPSGRAAWTADELAAGSLTHAIEPSGFGLLILTRQPWAKSRLRPVPAG
jgi:hypothetical protein